MKAAEFFKAGQLAQAIDAQIKEVKASPADHGKRMFLFELLAFSGDLERAGRQIAAVNPGDVERDTAAAAYHKLLEAEQARRRLFHDGLSPQFLVEPPESVRLRLEAVNRLREQRPAEAAEFLNRAAASTPDCQGELNGKPFTTLRDGDDLFAGILEVMAHGVYYWVPLEQIDSLAMNPPKFPRDLLWFPARLQMRDGPAGDVFLPTLYPGSHEHADDQVKLGRSTDWKTLEGGLVLGVGARTYLAGDEAVGLLEWRQLLLS